MSVTLTTPRAWRLARYAAIIRQIEQDRLDVAAIDEFYRQIAADDAIPPADCLDVCPVCEEKVDPSVLSAFRARHPDEDVVLVDYDMCSFHREETDKALWQSLFLGPSVNWRSLPDAPQGDLGLAAPIDWDSLPDALNANQGQHMSLLRDLYNGVTRSRYHRRFEAARYILGPRGSAGTPPWGYYGVTGSEIVHDLLTEQFLRYPAPASDDLSIRKRAPDFVAEVMVPEAICILIQQDLGLSAKQGFWVLEHEEIRAMGCRRHPGIDAQDAYLGAHRKMLMWTESLPDKRPKSKWSKAAAERRLAELSRRLT